MRDLCQRTKRMFFRHNHYSCATRYDKVHEVSDPYS